MFYIKKNINLNLVFGAKPKLGKFDPGNPFLVKLVKLSRELRTWPNESIWFRTTDTLFYIIKNINLNLVFGAIPKLGKFDTGKPFVDKLVKLSLKLRTWSKKRLWF